MIVISAEIEKCLNIPTSNHHQSALVFVFKTLLKRSKIPSLYRILMLSFGCSALRMVFTFDNVILFRTIMYFYLERYEVIVVKSGNLGDTKKTHSVRGLLEQYLTNRTKNSNVSIQEF